MMTNLRGFIVFPALAVAGAMAAGAPAFGESSNTLLGKHPAGGVYKGRTAPVNLGSHKKARTFRTRLRAAAKRKPNYAGHMIVTSWGCGTACQVIALIDARTGKVSFAPEASSAGVAHRLTSRLLIVNPSEAIADVYGSKPPSWLKTKYYIWKGGRLVKIKQP